MGKRGRPPKDVQNVDSQKEHISPSVYLGKNIGRWEEHRLACGGGVGSHQDFARHLLALHCEHCPRSPVAAPSGVKISKDDGNAEDYSADGEKFTITLDGDCARQWRRLQRLAGYEAAEIEYLYWLLNVAEQMLGWKLPTSGEGERHSQAVTEGSSDQQSSTSSPYPISAPRHTVLPEYHVVSSEGNPNHDASSDDNTLPPGDDNKDDIDVKPTFVPDKDALTKYTLKWVDQTTTPYLNPGSSETHTPRLRTKDEIKPEGHLYGTEGSGRDIQKDLHLDTFNANTTSQVQTPSENVRSNTSSPVQHHDMNLPANCASQDNDGSKAPYGNYVDSVIMVADEVMKSRQLAYAQQDQDKEDFDELYVDDMDQDSGGSSGVEDPKDVDYIPHHDHKEVPLKRRANQKPKASTKKRVTGSAKRKKTKPVRQVKERKRVTSKRMPKETSKTKSKSKYLRRYFCNECNRNLKDPYYFQIHNHKMHGAEKPQKEKLCTECGKVFGCNTTLKTHQRMVHAEVVPRRICPICNHQVRKFDFNRHMRMSHSGLKYLCDICGAELKSKKGLLNHKRDVHLVPELQIWKDENGIPLAGHHMYGCDICGKILKNRNNLLDHKKVIHNPPTHYCQWSGCEKVFKNKKNLKTHMLLHTGEMPMKCKLCDYRCRQHSSLNWHMRHKHKTEPPMTRSRRDVREDVSRVVISDLSRESGQPQRPIDFPPTFYYPSQGPPQWPTANKPFTM